MRFDENSITYRQYYHNFPNIFRLHNRVLSIIHWNRGISDKGWATVEEVTGIGGFNYGVRCILLETSVTCLLSFILATDTTKSGLGGCCSNFGNANNLWGTTCRVYISPCRLISRVALFWSKPPVWLLPCLDLDFFVHFFVYLPSYFLLNCCGLDNGYILTAMTSTFCYSFSRTIPWITYFQTCRACELRSYGIWLSSDKSHSGCYGRKKM